MKRKYKIIEHYSGVSKLTFYSVKESRMWGLFWVTPQNEYLSRERSGESAYGWSIKFFVNLEDAVKAIAEYRESNINTRKTIKVL